ncbi:odorant receptor 131-2-like [Hyperolius riggenbachi]|uniref:odorant receptor 131-2-like n=1 Tax=Hyperolius riggenbachi TaxID=752182 RepID=UPI0035A31708
MNSSGIQSNATIVSSKSTTNLEVLRMTVMVPMCLCFFFFLLLVVGMLSIFFSSSSARETARYILLAHMLINDTVYLGLGILLFAIYFYPITFPAPFCYLVITVSSTTLKITPYTLAVMSLERYVAICFPLRHSEFCTAQRTFLAIVLIWTVGLIPNVADFIVLSSSVQGSFFLLYMKCNKAFFTITPTQETIRLFANSFTFALAGLIIIFTYVKIMVVAFKVASGRASASKAGKTVLLHAIQLLLCMTAFSSTVIEVLLKDNILVLAVINFCFFMCLPRFISPFIYGIRDELFLTYLRRHLPCHACKAKVNQLQQHQK